MSGFPYFDALLADLNAASAKVPGKTAVFYSGVDDNGDRNVDNAQGCVEASPGSYYRMQDTEVGNVLERAAASVFRGDITQAQYETIVSLGSQKFAQQASGNVIAFVGGRVSLNSYFVQDELVALLE